MAKKRLEDVEAAEAVASTDTVRVRLSADSPYGRVAIGNVMVERTGVAMLSREQFEQYAEEYGLEEVNE